MNGGIKFAVGVMVAGFGVALSTQAGLGATPISSVSEFLCIPGDAFVKVASREFGLPLSRLKITLDGSLTLVALVTSALSLGRIEGVREGTILSVFLVGTFIGLFSKVLPT